MDASEGRLLQALTDAVLAQYGEPEPGPGDRLEDIAGLLRGLAAQERAARCTDAAGPGGRIEVGGASERGRGDEDQ